MANQIEAFFRSDPDHDAAIAGIENHIRKFWEPRMRNAIIAYVNDGGTELGELATAAVRRLSSLPPVSRAATAPTG
jgi:formate dehydrogenase subunit delta